MLLLLLMICIFATSRSSLAGGDQAKSSYIMPGGWCLQILGAVLYQVQNRGWVGGCLSEIAKRGLVPRTIFQAILDLKSYKFCHFVQYLALSTHQSSSYTTLRAWIMHFPVLRGFLDGAVIYWVSSSADRSNSGHLSWNLAGFVDHGYLLLLLLWLCYVIHLDCVVKWWY